MKAFQFGIILQVLGTTMHVRSALQAEPGADNKGGILDAWFVSLADMLRLDQACVHYARLGSLTTMQTLRRRARSVKPENGLLKELTRLAFPALRGSILTLLVHSQNPLAKIVSRGLTALRLV
jgi:hypothetical protein